MERLIFNGCRFHRNGCGGAGYYVVGLAWTCEGERFTGTATVFELVDSHPQLQGCVAILDQRGDSWRYEDFAAEVIAFVHSGAGQRLAFPNVAEAYR